MPKIRQKRLLKVRSRREAKFLGNGGSNYGDVEINKNVSQLEKSLLNAVTKGTADADNKKRYQMIQHDGKHLERVEIFE